MSSVSSSGNKDPGPSDGLQRGKDFQRKITFKEITLKDNLPLEDSVIAKLSEAGFNYISDVQNLRASDLHAGSCFGVHVILFVLELPHSYVGISRIRRNLSIHIARFSASESPRAIYQHSQNSPIFAGS